MNYSLTIPGVRFPRNLQVRGARPCLRFPGGCITPRKSRLHRIVRDAELVRNKHRGFIVSVELLLRDRGYSV